MVDQIIGGKGFGPLNETRGSRKAAPKDSVEKGARSDRVEFSDVLQNASRVVKTEVTAESSRNEKVQELKQQIASGQYRPDLEKVAASLLKFIVEEKT